MRTFRSAFLVAALVSTLGSAGVARAQAIPFDLEVGYRFLDVIGSEESYRSQINEREGFLVRSIHLGTDGKTDGFPILDHLRIDGSDLGAGPAGSLFLDAGLAGAYRLRLSYRHLDQFSALAGFANPLGAPIGQHTWDRTRNMVDVNLEILPGAVVTPLFGYTSNNLNGPGYTTTFVGQDEFRLAQDLKVHDQEVRAGLGFHAGAFSGEFLQGWRRYRETEKDTLVPGAGAGNNKGTVLDNDLNLSSLTRSSVTDVNTPTSSFFLRGFATDAIQLIAFYVRANAGGDSTDQENLNGSLVSFQLARFFTGLTDNSSSRVQNTMWRAGGRVEFHVLDGLDVTGGYVHRDATWDGQDLVTSLFTGTSSFTGVTLADIQTILNAQTSVERTEDVFDVQVAAKALGPFGVRAGYSRIEQDLTVTQDPSEIRRSGRPGRKLHAQHQPRRGRSHLRDGPLLRGRRSVVGRRGRGGSPHRLPHPQSRARPRHLERLLVAHGRRDRAVDRPGERHASASTRRAARACTPAISLSRRSRRSGPAAPTARCRPTTGFPSAPRRTSPCSTP